MPESQINRGGVSEGGRRGKGVPGPLTQAGDDDPRDRKIAELEEVIEKYKEVTSLMLRYIENIGASNDDEET